MRLFSKLTFLLCFSVCVSFTFLLFATYFEYKNILIHLTESRMLTICHNTEFITSHNINEEFLNNHLKFLKNENPEVLSLNLYKNDVVVFSSNPIRNGSQLSPYIKNFFTPTASSWQKKFGDITYIGYKTNTPHYDFIILRYHLKTDSILPAFLKLVRQSNIILGLGLLCLIIFSYILFIPIGRACSRITGIIQSFYATGDLPSIPKKAYQLENDMEEVLKHYKEMNGGLEKLTHIYDQHRLYQ